MKKDPSINMGKARFELAKDNPLGLQPSAFDRLAISPCIGVCGLRESNPHFWLEAKETTIILNPRQMMLLECVPGSNTMDLPG